MIEMVESLMMADDRGWRAWFVCGPCSAYCRGEGPVALTPYGTIDQDPIIIRVTSEVKRILVVDDDVFFLQGLEKALRSDATGITAVETGTSALEEIASSSYQLCFLDLFLSDMEGTEVLKKIKEISPQTRVVVMTAGIVTPSIQGKIERDAYMFITKPFDLLQVKMLARRITEETACS